MQESNINLIHGDCITVMQELISEDVKVDLVLTDLPYGTTQNKWDSIIPLDEMWICLHELTYIDSPVLLFSQMPFAATLVNSNLKEFRYEWIWQKEQGTGFLNANRMPLKIHENILVFYRKLPVYNPQMRDSERRVVYRNDEDRKSDNYGDYVYHSKSEYNGRYPIDIINFQRDNGKVHPTQKPVSLLEYLIKTYTKEDDTVLDFTMGSGSTGVACKNLNRKFIGIEYDKEYYDIACSRIFDKQTKIGDY